MIPQPDFLKIALRLADKGLYVFPLFPNEKRRPSVKNWFDEASIDPEKIKEWWGKNPRNNIAISTKKSNLTVIDVDVKNGGDGLSSLFNLEKKYGKLPETLKIETPSGGFHLYFKGLTQQIVGNKSGKGLGKSIDTRSDGAYNGGFVVAPGSVTSEGKYKVCERHEIADLPKWAFDLLGTPSEEDALSQTRMEAPVLELDQQYNIDQMIVYLENHAEISVEGSGNETTFRVACRLKDNGLSLEKTQELMLKYYSPRCEPPWEGDEDKFFNYIKNAFTYSRHTAQGASSALYQFSDEGGAPKEEKLAKPISASPFFVYDYAYLLNQHAFVHLEHKYLLSVSAFNQVETRNYKLPKGCKNLSDAIKSGNIGIQECFDTGYRPENVQFFMDDKGRVRFNQYLHQDVSPKEGDVTPFLNHMEYLIEDKDSREHILDFMAHCIQKPLQKILHAICIQSDMEGIGKGFLVACMQKMIGKSNAVEIEGDILNSVYNGPYVSKRFVLIDELLGVNRTVISNKLKPLIGTLTIDFRDMQKKHVKYDNFANIFIFSNHKQFLKVAHGDRRFHVTLCEQEPKPDTYYEDLFNWLNDEGGAILFDFFSKRDLSHFNHAGKAPSTASKKVLEEITTDAYEQYISDLMDRKVHPFNRTIITLQEVIDSVIEARVAKSYIGRKDLRNRVLTVFKKYNRQGLVKKIDKEVRVTNGDVNRYDFWMVNNFNQKVRLESLTPKQLLKFYEDQPQNTDLNEFDIPEVDQTSNVLPFTGVKSVDDLI